MKNTLASPVPPVPTSTKFQHLIIATQQLSSVKGGGNPWIDAS